MFVFECPDVVAQRGVVAFAAVPEGATLVVEMHFKLIVCYSCECFLLSAVLFGHRCLVDHAARQALSVQRTCRLLSAVAVCLSGICGAFVAVVVVLSFCIIVLLWFDVICFIFGMQL